MTDYKTIRGKKVKFFTSDLSGGEAEGQLFFQDTAREMKVAVASAAWSSGAPLNTARFNGDSGQTPVTAAIYFGGGAPPKNATEEYDGSGWSSGGDMNTGRTQLHGFGTQTTAVGSAGYVDGSGDVANVEEYNGSSWTEVTNTPASRRGGASFGTLTAGVIVGGHPNLNTTLEYDGTNWTSGGNIGTGMDRTEGAGAGTLTAGLVVAGDTTESFTYDGSTWTDVGTSNNTHDGGVDMGIQTSAVIATGFGAPGSGVVTTTELYDGTSFSSSTAVSTGRYGSGKGGVASTAAFIAGGDQNPGTVSITEEFNITVNTVTASAWSSGGNLNTSGRAGAAGSGIQTASIIAGGGLGTVLNNTESYNGSSWTNLPTLGTARGYMAGATNAPYTASLAFGGATSPGGPYVNNSEEYNGSSWAEGNNLNQARGYLAGFGTQTAGAAAGGTTPGPRAAEVEEYDGTSWSEVNNMPTGAIAFGGCGTQTTGLIIGDAPMKGATYDGTNWTTIPTMNVGGNYNKVFGTSASAMSCGRNPGQGTVVEEWNGTNWFSQASLATGRFNGGQTGTTTAGLVAGPPTATEEFAAETTSLNLKTITDS